MSRWLLLVLVLLPSAASAQGIVQGALPEIPPAEIRVPPRDGDRAALRAQLAARRRAHVVELRRYARRGEFPRNRSTPGFGHVFRDDEGNLCAVANLIWQDGETRLVEDTVQGRNDVHLADVREGGLHEWMLASGFTIEEIDRIQEPGWEISEETPRQRLRIELEREKARIRAHLATVLRELADGESRSLDLAVDRLLAHRGAAS
jgi:hypothetical protein